MFEFLQTILDALFIHADSSASAANPTSSTSTPRQSPPPSPRLKPADHSTTTTSSSSSSDSVNPVSDPADAASQSDAYDPETGEINWDCPCLGPMTKPPCGEDFKAAFSCFVYSKEEPKGLDCVNQFRLMQECFRKYPEVYGPELTGDDEDDEDDDEDDDDDDEESDMASAKLDMMPPSHSNGPDPVPELKSKRLKASKKHKIERKVVEHHRKMRKDAKKNPSQKRLKKDPGIPSLLPFKDKLLQQVKETKEKLAVERKQKGGVVGAAGGHSDERALMRLVSDAKRRALSFEGTNPSGMLAYDGKGFEDVAVAKKDNSKKAYYKEFQKVVGAADVILEILDARDPIGCRPKQIEEMVINSGINKRIILVLNKIDLVPRDVVEKWLKYLRNEFPTIAFKASTQSQRTNLGQSKVDVHAATEDLLNSSDCIGADNLVKLLKNYCRNAHIKTSITVGVIGYPNVGKSSVINSLKRSKACNVGSTPGVTKVTQEIHLDKNIKLLDCPGIVFSKSESGRDNAEVLLRNCVKVELMEDPIAPVELIVSKCKVQDLMIMYNLPAFSNAREFLIHLARQRGKLRKGGIPDLDNTARSILNDWNTGRIPYYTIPPATGIDKGAHISSSIVSGWSQEFQMPDIMEMEGKDLAVAKAQGVGRMLAVSTIGSGEVDEEALVEDEMEDDDEGQMEDDDDEEAPELMEHDEEDEEMVEEDDEEAEEEEEEAPKIAMNLSKAFKTKGKKIAPSKPIQTVEQVLNPQTNRDRKKTEKQKKKANRKAGRGGGGAYSFDEHFGAGGEEMEED
ncbi:Guanine nucleotide-binding protein-like 3 [Irineochytrium annulatum]|nr:Guanine nucleotide-binding protein-like 3 [Irineochytrium annulatum]